MKLPELTPSRIIRALIIIIVILALVYITHDEAPPNDADLRLVPIDIPQDENAFTWFREAGQKLSPDTGKDLDFFYGCCVDTGDAIARDPKLMEDVVRKNAESIDLVKMGLACSRIESLLPERYPYKAPHMAQWGRLARVMSLKAIALARAGDDREAMDDLLDLVAFGHKVAKCRGGSLHYLTGVAISQIGYRALGQALPEIDLPPDALMQYASKLAAMADGDEALADALRADYMRDIQQTDDMLDGKLIVDGKRVPKQRLNFLFLRNATKRLHADIHRTAIRNIGRKPDQYEVSRTELTSRKMEHSKIPRKNMIGLMLASFLAPSLDKICLHGLEARAGNAMARLLIALRCHHMKTGTLPESLDKLVPDYIDAVPVDPFDGKPIRYDPAKKIIYSIGTDCEDNGGDEKDDTVVRIEF